MRVRAMRYAVVWAAILAATPACREKPGESAAVKEVRLGYFANLTHAQALLGVASGEYERAVVPASLKTQVFNAGPSLIEALLAGEIDIGYVGPGPAINAHSKTRGRGIRVICGAAANGVVIVVAKDSGIEKLQDLKGKRIATPQLGNTQDISARHYLLDVLKQENADNILPISNAEQASMMARGQIDAAWSPEPWGTRITAEAGGRVLAEEKELWPDKRFGLTLVVTTPEFLERHPEVVGRFLESHASWTARLSQTPEKYAPDLSKAIGDLTGQNIPEAIIAEAIKRVTFTDDPLPASLATFAQWSYDLGFLKQPPDVRGLVDTTLLPKEPNR